jgi:DNA mismatch endonuclease (patch repair protein)
MTDVFTKEKRSEVMSRIRGHGNKETELALVKLFRRHRITGWRRQATLSVDGHISSRPRLRVKADFVFCFANLAVFVDGCFWHACPKHSSVPTNNRAFWLRKLEGNRARDRKVSRALRAAGWSVVRIWEHELMRKNEARVVTRLRRALVARAGGGVVKVSRQQRTNEATGPGLELA